MSFWSLGVNFCANLEKKRENRNIKRELENTEEDLAKAQKKIKSVTTERDEMVEEHAQSERRIRLLDSKLENANKEIAQYLDEISKLRDLNAEQKQKLDDNDEERKQLHEQIQQLKGNIRVFSRVRPLLPSELEKVKKSISKL